MQSEAPGQRPSGPDDDNLSQSNKRRRTSERSTRTIPEPSESSNALATGRRTLTKASPQSGSSRDMTPPESEGAIKYTRTGRVSKATKGQRVHHCDECGKVSLRIPRRPRWLAPSSSSIRATMLLPASLCNHRPLSHSSTKSVRMAQLKWSLVLHFAQRRAIGRDIYTMTVG